MAASCIIQYMTNARNELKTVGIQTDDENAAILHVEDDSHWHVHLEAALLYGWPIAIRVDDLGAFHKMYVMRIEPENKYTHTVYLACDGYYAADEEKSADAAHVFSKQA